MEKLSGDFIRGYTKAIKDLEDVVVQAQDDLTHCKKRLNYKLCIRLIKLFLEHRENFRENLDGFIRWNSQLNDFEFFKGGVEK